MIRPFQGYGQFLHLDRGYAFFAPDPGPSRLIQAAIVQPDGSVQEELYPDLSSQWPRLLYHRHFMLTEYLSEIYQPPGPPNEMFEIDPLEAQLWQRARGRYEYVRQSMIDHLRTVNDDKQVAIRRIEHALPTLAQFNESPLALDDPRSYNVLLDQPVVSDTIAPTGPTEVIPPPTTPGQATDAGPLSPPAATAQPQPSDPSRGLESATDSEGRP
ncbi:hypothetical protein FYK55_21350 [Roseiconus nitratireducens]|uniref:Uncharacterized protein n=1 Tax=Roseiconus nitratireducens TaxID=2605748 RepID=A0A5M6CY93_9BACT|nr:hypothetical protein [Roseiconus nitratireducens]KAA5540188.1 hypothetical protein FYK55_21350 [Roseiconus nitratireducens]